MDPANLKFAKTHEWVSVAGEFATVGISDFAVKELTDVVHLELPQVGRAVRQGDSIGEIESVKAVSDIYAPIDGQIVEVNSRLEGDLTALSDDPFGAGWMVKLKVSNPGQLASLMDYPAYQASCEHH